MDSYKLVIEEIESRAKSVTDQKVKKELEELISIFMEMDARQIATSEVDDLLKRLKSLLISDLLHKQVLRLKMDLLGHLRKQYGIVTPNYYRNLWMILGMSIFGMPIGVMFGFMLDNMAFLSIGLPMGMPIGMAIGMGKDKKAQENGLVINSAAYSI